MGESAPEGDADGGRDLPGVFRAGLGVVDVIIVVVDVVVVVVVRTAAAAPENPSEEGDRGAQDGVGMRQAHVVREYREAAEIQETLHIVPEARQAGAGREAVVLQSR